MRSKLRSPRRGNPAIYKVGTALRAVRCFPGSVPLFSKCGISCEIGPNRVHGWPATVCHSAKVHQAAIRTVATKRIDSISAIDRARTRLFLARISAVCYILGCRRKMFCELKEDALDVQPRWKPRKNSRDLRIRLWSRVRFTRFSPALSRLRASRNSRSTIVSALNSSMGRLPRRGGAHQIGQGVRGEGGVNAFSAFPSAVLRRQAGEKSSRPL